MKPADALLDSLDWTRMKLPPPEQRASGLPVATHTAVLELGGHNLRCYQLSNGARLIDADDVKKFFGLMEDAQ